MQSPDPPRRLPFFQSLGVQLFAGLFLLVLAAFAAYAAVSVRAMSREWRQSAETGALAWSELIQQATRQGMLKNHKEDVHEIIRTVAATPGVVGVRVYDKRGVIIYSAAPGEIGRAVDVKGEACVICHRGNPPLSFVPRGDRVRVFRTADGGRVLGLINPIESSRACSGEGCHPPPERQPVLGVLDVKMSLAEADQHLAAARRLSILAAVVMALAVGVASALFLDRFVRRPVRSLIEGTHRIARGDLDSTLDAASGNELGQLARAFNGMTRELALSRRENEEWANLLESKVVEETAKVSRTERQVMHVEKMASLGTLAATVAHELNNPLAGILNYAKLVERSLKEEAEKGSAEEGEREEVGRFLRVIQDEAARCGRIVRNFLVFARRSGGELAPHSLNAIAEQALAIVRHHLEMKRVALDWIPLAGGDEVVCDAGQIQQALLNLLVNAVEAMPEGGTLTAEILDVGSGRVQVRVSDTGGGIPEEALPHLFEPFFTTKQESGSGLGLSVVWGIVERHGGTIDVDSEPGRGATFRLTLPRRPPSGEPHE